MGMAKELLEVVACMLLIMLRVVWGLGFGVWGLGFRVWSLGLGV